MELEVCMVQDDGQRIAVVERGRKWVKVTTLRKSRRMTQGAFEELRPAPVDEFVGKAALKLFKERGLVK